MEKKLNKPRNKPFFCYDECLEFHVLKRECNKFAQFQSFIQLTGKQGTKDQDAISDCNKNDKHIITRNTKHFRNPHEKIKIGVLCIDLKSEQSWNSKFMKLLRKYPKHKDLYYKTILIGNNLQIKDRKTGTINLI